jgi:uncharacterized protein YunC (DUF1805 family)
LAVYPFYVVRLSNKVPVVGKTVGIVATGGNLDVAKFAAVLGCPHAGGSTVAPVPHFDWTGFESSHVHGLTRPLVMIKTRGALGFLGCGYFSIEGIDALGEVGATVSKVSTPEGMLHRPVVAVTSAAAALGITVGMLGSDALELMRANASKL